MAYIIKDLNTKEYYRQRLGPNGWYGLDINASRVYREEKQAQKTIDDNGHHVSYPDNRDLVIIEVELVEIINPKVEG